MRRIAGLLSASPSVNGGGGGGGGGFAATEPVCGGDFSAGPRPPAGHHGQAAHQQEISQLVERVSAFLSSLLRQHDNDARTCDRRFQQIERSVACLRESVAGSLEWREKWAEVQGSVSGVIEESQMLARRVETLDERLWSKMSGFDLAKQRHQDLENQVRAVEQQGRLAVASLEGAQKRQAAKLWRSERALEDVTKRLTETEEALRWWAADSPALPAADAAGGGGCGGPGGSQALTWLGGSPQELLRDLSEQVSHLSQRAARGEATLAALQAQAQDVEGGGVRQAEEVANLAHRLQSVEGWLEDCSAQRHQGERGAVEQVADLDSRINSAEGWLEELSQRGPEWDGQIAALRERLSGMESWLADTQGWTAQVSAELGAQMAAEVGDLRERQAELLEASGGMSRWKEQLGQLEAALEGRHEELSGLREQAVSLDGTLRSCQGEILETTLTVKTLSQQVSSMDGDLQEQHHQISQAHEGMRLLSEQAVAFGGDLRQCHKDLQALGGAAAQLQERAELEARERREQLASMDGTVRTLSEHMAILDSNFRGCQGELLEAGRTIQSLAEQAAVMDRDFQEAGERRSAALESGLQEQLAELRETSGSLEALLERVAALEGLSREQRGELLRAGEGVEALRSEVADLDSQCKEQAAERPKDLAAIKALSEETLEKAVGELSARVSGLERAGQDDLAGTAATIEALASKLEAEEGRNMELEAKVGRVAEAAEAAVEAAAKAAAEAAAADSREREEELAAAVRSVKELSARVAAMGDKHQEHNDELASAARTVSDLSSQVASLHGKHQERSDELEVTVRTVEGLSAQVAALDGRHREHQEHSDELAVTLAAVKDLSAQVAAQAQQEQSDELAVALRAVRDLSAQVASHQERHDEASRAIGALDSLPAQVAALDCGLGEHRDELGRTSGRVEALAAQVTALDASSRENPEEAAKTVGILESLSTQVGALQSNFQELAGQVTTLDGSSRENPEVAAKTLGTLESLSTQVNALQSNFQELAGQVASLSESSREHRGSLAESAAAVAALCSDVSAVANRSEEQRGGLAETAAAVEELAAKVTALDTSLHKCPDAIAKTSSSVESLYFRVNALDSSFRQLAGKVTALDSSSQEQHKTLAETAATVTSLSANVSAVESASQALASQLAGAEGGARSGQGELAEPLAAKVSALECSFSEHQREFSDSAGSVKALALDVSALEDGLEERRSDAAALSSRVASIDELLHAQRGELAAVGESMRSLVDQASDFQAQLLRLQPPPPQPLPALGAGSEFAALRVHIEALREAELEGAVPPELEDAPSAEELEQALERLQASCTQTSQDLVAAARSELAAALRPSGFCPADCKEAPDDRGLLRLELRSLEEQMGIGLGELAAAEGSEVLQRQLQAQAGRTTEQVLAKLPNASFQQELREAKAAIGRLAEQVASLEAVSLRQPAADLLQAGLPRGHLASEFGLVASGLAHLRTPARPALQVPLSPPKGSLELGGPAAAEEEEEEEERRRAREVDGALERLHAACLEAAEGIASAARRELVKMELEPADQPWEAEEERA